MSHSSTRSKRTTPSGLAAEDGILLISERENKLPLSTANEKQNKQKMQSQFAEQMRTCANSTGVRL